MSFKSRTGFISNTKTKILIPRSFCCYDVSVVIPVKDNQDGIDRFLREFFLTHKREFYPKEIIIVDNNSHSPIIIRDEFLSDKTPIRLLKCSRKGPACARNDGYRKAVGEWILFTDSDCLPTETFLTGYINAANGAVAYAGNVRALGNNDVLSQYYDEQEILIPPKYTDENGTESPEYLVTANCLVWKDALHRIGGFDESFPVAGGEDIDLGFRLRQIGKLSFALDSVVHHNFEDGILGFLHRFYRYGIGNGLVARLHSLNLKPRFFLPNNRRFVNYFIACLQFLTLRIGYETCNIA